MQIGKIAHENEDVKKSPYQENHIISIVGAGVSTARQRKRKKNQPSANSYHGVYLFAEGILAFAACTARGVREAAPYDVN